MSTDASPYSRENFYAGSDDYDSTAEPDGGHHEHAGVSRHKYIAGSILRSAGDPTLLCPHCWHQLDRPSEVSEPEDYVPTSQVVDVRDPTTDAWVPATDSGVDLDNLDDDELRTREWYGDHRRHRHCTNEDCGMLVWGGVLADRPREDFLAIVAHVLDFTDLRQSAREAIHANATSRKDRGWSDEANMERAVAEIEHPGEIDT